MSREPYNLSTICVTDGFVADPDAVRASAMASGFGTWRPNKGEVGSSIYDGMNFWGDHGTLLRGVRRVLKMPVYPNSMFFRVTNEATEAAYVHSDREAGDITAIVYLSKHGEDSGTGFYRHRETGMDRMPPFSELVKDPPFFDTLKAQMVKGSPDDWELMHFVPGAYNRCLIFDAPRFHSRSPRHGFGSTPEEGRLVWACHFGIGD